MKGKFHFRYVEFEMPVEYLGEIVKYIVVLRCLELGESPGAVDLRVMSEEGVVTSKI